MSQVHVGLIDECFLVGVMAIHVYQKIKSVEIKKKKGFQRHVISFPTKLAHTCKKENDYRQCVEFVAMFLVNNRSLALCSSPFLTSFGM